MLLLLPSSRQHPSTPLEACEPKFLPKHSPACTFLGRQFLLGGVGDLARGPRLACIGTKVLLTPMLDYRKRPISQLPCPWPGFAHSSHS